MIAFVHETRSCRSFLWNRNLLYIYIYIYYICFCVCVYICRLGKTVQITVFLASLIASGKIHAALVLAPVSVLTAWQKEIKKWYPSLRLGCFHGTSKKQREMDLERVQRRGGVCLSTYGMFVCLSTLKQT